MKPSDYFQNDIRVCIDMSEYEGILEEQFGNMKSPLISTYDSRLIYNQIKPELIQLTIYHPHSDYLFEKLLHLRSVDINLLDLIKPEPKESKWHHPDVLLFSESKLVNIQESHYWEHNKKPVILTIDNASLMLEGRYSGDGRFKLTENAFQHIKEYVDYGLLGRHRYNDRFIDSDNNKDSRLGPAKFKLSFEHFYGPSTAFEISIIRDAYLTVTDDSGTLTDEQIIKIGEAICLLMSFYWQKSIDFFKATIRVINNADYRTREVLKYSNHTVDKNKASLLEDKFSTFYDFIDSIEYEKFINNSSIINDSITRIIKTKDVDEISAFMVFYNIIEKIRNYCKEFPLDNNKLEIKEEFDFNVSKSATDKFIKNKIKEVQEIVAASDVDAFVEKASDKVSFIKKTGLIDQFDSLVGYLGLTPSDYGIDFPVLIKLRNKIYHGDIPKGSVKPYSGKMVILIYDMLIKMMV